MLALRKWNTIAAAVLVGLLLVHGLLGCYRLLGFQTAGGRLLGVIMLGLLVFHASAGFFFSFSAMRNCKFGKPWYLAANWMFWARHISGLAILILIPLHFYTYGVMANNGGFLVLPFPFTRLLAQILLIAAILIHLVLSLRSFLMKFFVIAAVFFP